MTDTYDYDLIVIGAGTGGNGVARMTAATVKGLEFDTHFEKTSGWYSSMRVGATTSGFKVLVEQKTGLILGAHLIGPGAEEQINLFAMAMGAGLTANQIKAMIFAYPSFASDIGSMV